ncbi:CDPK-related protein kinase [Hibiscus syriacus]|uniref:non-specific serine/threonine protein kinase n=1 Tax=Hibiscus syriacus TaxID=106335 RepID=A0A6A2XAS0_HIBSY|nr:CDPK-related protein kinase [Hibiscus syriacus]
MGLCTSKPPPNPSFSPKSDSRNTPIHHRNNDIHRNSNLFHLRPYLIPSPAHYLFSKKSPARSSASSTPKQVFMKPFPPPSPAKHIRALLARRHGSVKPNESVIPEGSEVDADGWEGVTGTRLDKSFGFSKHFESKYELGEELGRGHFGYTCAAKFKKGELKGQHVAVKVIPKAKMTTAIAIEDVRREVKILRALSGHKNLVHFYDAYEDHDNVYIVMELCEGGELLDKILSRGGKYNEDDAKAVMIHILNVVSFCHLQGVVHRDLKPEGFLIVRLSKICPRDCSNFSYFLDQNFLFTSKDENSQLKAIDFGLSDFVKPDERLNDIVGSAYYVAPEVLHRSYSTEADVWSIGVIAYILLCGSRPFWARTESGIFRAVLKADPSFDEAPWPSISSEARDFVKRLLNKDPRKRLTAAQALSHPWIKNYNDMKVPLDILIFKLMKAYLRSSSLRKAAIRALSKTLTVDELFYLKEQFALLEPNKNGTISLENIKVSLMKNGTDAMKESRIHEFLASLNALQYGRMDFDEFCAAALSVHQLEALDRWEQHARCAYELFEKDGNRAIVIDELASELGLSPSVPVHSILHDWIRHTDGKLKWSRDILTLPDIQKVTQRPLRSSEDGQGHLHHDRTQTSRHSLKDSLTYNSVMHGGEEIAELTTLVKQATDGTKPPKWWEEKDNQISKLESRMTPNQGCEEQIFRILTERTEEQEQTSLENKQVNIPNLPKTDGRKPMLVTGINESQFSYKPNEPEILKSKPAHDHDSNDKLFKQVFTGGVDKFIKCEFNVEGPNLYMDRTKNWNRLEFAQQLQNQMKVQEELSNKIVTYYDTSWRNEDVTIIAGLQPLHLIHETTATTLAYGIYKTDLPENDLLNVALVDIGHASLQVYIAAFKKHFATKFKEEYKIDVFQNDRACTRLQATYELEKEERGKYSSKGKSENVYLGRVTRMRSSIHPSNSESGPLGTSNNSFITKKNNVVSYEVEKGKRVDCRSKEMNEKVVSGRFTRSRSSAQPYMSMSGLLGLEHDASEEREQCRSKARGEDVYFGRITRSRNSVQPAKSENSPPSVGKSSTVAKDGKKTRTRRGKPKTELNGSGSGMINGDGDGDGDGDGENPFILNGDGDGDGDEFEKEEIGRFQRKDHLKERGICSVGNYTRIYSREEEYSSCYERSTLLSWYREIIDRTIILINAVNAKTYELQMVEMLALIRKEIEGDVLNVVEVIPKVETQQWVWGKYKKNVGYKFGSIKVGHNTSQNLIFWSALILQLPIHDPCLAIGFLPLHSDGLQVGQLVTLKRTNERPKDIGKSKVSQNNDENLLVRWMNLNSNHDTWEAHTILRPQFPCFDHWGQGSFHKGGIVMHKGEEVRLGARELGKSEKGHPDSNLAKQLTGDKEIPLSKVEQRYLNAFGQRRCNSKTLEKHYRMIRGISMLSKKYCSMRRGIFTLVAEMRGFPVKRRRHPDSNLAKQSTGDKEIPLSKVEQRYLNAFGQGRCNSKTLEKHYRMIRGISMLSKKYCSMRRGIFTLVVEMRGFPVKSI